MIELEKKQLLLILLNLSGVILSVSSLDTALA
jgi:hypothetical protein